MIGTRGVPAAYGGFETAVEEIGQRLVRDGHNVIVYCRSTGGPEPRTHLGMKLVYLPAFHSRAIETLSHTFLSVLHLLVHRHPDMAFVFNAANSPFLPLLRLANVPTAVHVDGLEWKRGKWGRVGRTYYRIAERLAVWWADSLIADAQGIADYYRSEFDVDTELLTYGAQITEHPASDRLHELGLEAGRFHLVVARFEPENHVDVIVDGYTASAGTLPLVVVGSAPYSADYTNRIAAVAERDDRIRMLGGVWDQGLLDQLYGNALTYLHGHSVGGTNPSLLRAMGAGAAVVAWDVNFNREVVGNDGGYFTAPSAVAAAIEHAESAPEAHAAAGARLRERAASRYDWDEVAGGYESLALRLADRQPVQERVREGSRVRAGT
ncbi:MAG: DUF1972 domain-containing protein [Burkholderiaceae bacterium]|nr:DUF1972 domain-containing protein [Microbacteriaceae bacterium]